MQCASAKKWHKAQESGIRSERVAFYAKKWQHPSRNHLYRSAEPNKIAKQITDMARHSHFLPSIATLFFKLPLSSSDCHSLLQVATLLKSKKRPHQEPGAIEGIGVIDRTWVTGSQGYRGTGVQNYGVTGLRVGEDHVGDLGWVTKLQSCRVTESQNLTCVIGYAKTGKRKTGGERGRRLREKKRVQLSGFSSWPLRFRTDMYM